MATPVDTRPGGSSLGTLITAYLRAAESGRTLDRSGNPYSAARVRSLRRALGQVEAAAGPLDPAALNVMDAAALERLGRQVVDHAGLPASRLETIVDALRGLSAYAGAGRPRADRLRRREPFPWPDPPSWLDPPSRAEAHEPAPTSQRAAARESTPPPPPAAAPEARTPTFTMLALGAQVSAWTQRIIVIAFVLTAIGLALELL
jgi:hypothetical protein